MGFIKGIGIGQERLTTGLGTQVDCPAAIFQAREIGRVGLPKFSSTEGHETRVLPWFE